jgi:hypothetical protein
MAAMVSETSPVAERIAAICSAIPTDQIIVFAW